MASAVETSPSGVEPTSLSPPPQVVITTAEGDLDMEATKLLSSSHPDSCSFTSHDEQCRVSSSNHTCTYSKNRHKTLSPSPPSRIATTGVRTVLYRHHHHHNHPDHSIENSLHHGSNSSFRRSSVKSLEKVIGPCECKNYWGIMFSLISGLASTFGGLIVRYMKDFHPFSLATYRFQGILLPTLAVLLYYLLVKKKNVFRSVWPLKDRDKFMAFGFTIIRAVIGCFGLYLYFYAIKLMPLADAKVILSCRPVFVILVAHVFLQEACGIFPILAAMLSMIGVGIIARPPIITGEGSFDTDTLMGTIFATLSMLAATLSMVILRYLRGVHVTIVTLVFGIWGTILSSGCSAAVNRFDVPASGQEGILLLCLAFSAFLSQTTITLAMKYENAGVVVLVGTCDTIMSFVLQYFILGDEPDAYSILGASLIVTCVSLITFRKWLQSLPEKHAARKYFRYVLM